VSPLFKGDRSFWEQFFVQEHDCSLELLAENAVDSFIEDM